MTTVVAEDIFDVQLWLLQDGKEMGTLFNLMKAYVPRIQQRHSIPIDRMIIATPNIIHPQLGAYLITYESNKGYEEKSFPKPALSRLQATADNAAPFKQLAMGADFVRVRPTDDVISDSVRSLFTDQGDGCGAYTDMYALPVWYRGRVTAYVSWATWHPDGFLDTTLDFFNATQPALSTVLQLLSSERTSRDLRCTYLGKDPGSRVYRGSVCRGDGVTVRTVVWFSDMRGFTTLSCELGRDDTIQLINDVFEQAEAALKDHGGEILKFMGDGLLAVFSDDRPNTKSKQPKMSESSLGPMSECNSSFNSITHNDDLDDSLQSYDTGRALCERATNAARNLQERLVGLRARRAEQGLAEPEVGIGLHYGDCSYGNIGSDSRLDFTVIGPAVNLACRMEGLCSTLQASLLATEEFVNLDPGKGSWCCRGEFHLKGVPNAVSVFELQEMMRR